MNDFDYLRGYTKFQPSEMWDMYEEEIIYWKERAKKYYAKMESIRKKHK